MLFRKLNRAMRALRRDEEGVALAAVLGFMAVGLILTSVVASTVVTGISQTSAARAGVQSQGSADAGIAAARAAVMNGSCSGDANAVFTGTDPVYTATVYRPAGTGWVPGCPTSVTSADQVRIVSVGSASAKGVQGVSSGDSSRVEAILSGVTTTVIPGAPAQPATYPIVASGPAIYAYSSTGFGGSGSLSPVDGSTPGVLIKNGNVSCSGASSGVDDWSIAGGDLTVSGSCTAAGDIFASGRATLSGAGSIGGNVVANGVTMSGSASVAGSVWSSSDVQLSGATKIAGTVTANSLNMSGGTISQSAWIYNTSFLDWGSTITGMLTTKAMSASSHGTVSGSTVVVPSGPGQSPYAAPSAPSVPGWIDLPANAPWPGFTVKTLPAPCDATAFASLISSFNRQPAVIDARGCSGGLNFTGAQQLALTADTVIIANQFNLGGSASFTGNGRLWLVVPDDKADGLPTCATGDSFSLGGAFSLAAPLSVMIYSPCAVSVGSAISMRGQIYSGAASIAGAARLAYIQIGVPGWNLSTGGSTATPAVPATPDRTVTTPRALLTYRDLAGSS